MPRKKQGASSKNSTPGKSATSTTRRSKLAKDNDISAEEEGEIKSAWSLFKQDEIEGFEDEKEGVIRTSDVKLVLRAQGLEPKSASELKEILEILDPEEDGYVTYPHFVELCAIQMNNSRNEGTNTEEVEKAFQLFTKGIERPISLQDLRLVAKTLREDVSDDVLKAMILEANGGTGVSRGVDMDAFRTVMTRAGMFQ